MPQFRIKQKRFFNGPRETHTFIKDMDSLDRDDLTFPSRQAAKEWIEADEAQIYRLDHNEYARPEYRIFEIKY